MEWKTVYVFVSSTFNDMHAERDLLVKRVFPELRLWCAGRKLQLREIDLRWGVSAADAQENKRVVEVCLRNIDKCRPFFLCFMGQRRGWVPGAADINPETLRMYPGLREHVGKASVTEMEILHALLRPMASGATPVRHARFYFREDGYVKDLHTRAHKDLFAPGRGFFRNADKDMERFQKQLTRQFPGVSYSARWNPELPSPELTGALAMGRLENFRTGDTMLEADLLAWLKNAITQEFPDHRELPEETDLLERELDMQDTQRFYGVDGYIPRPAEEQALREQLKAAGTTPLYLVAEAGCGKTSMLAAMITAEKGRCYYRFVGTTAQSFRLEDLTRSLIAQWVRDGLLEPATLEHPAGELVLLFPQLCVQAACVKPFTLILDGMDQLADTKKWIHWLPAQMPAGASLLVSLRRGSVTLPEGLRIHTLGLMEDPGDRAVMATAYLNGFLKDIDAEQLEKLLEMEGSSNPLYMKIVLNELRQHGSFDTLMELFRKDFGTAPLEAFRQVLNRVEQELKDTGMDPGNAMQLFFVVLANARRNLDSQLLLWGARCLSGMEEEKFSDRQIRDLIYGLAREMEPYLVLDGDSFAIRYDSLRRAIIQYAGPELNRYANIMLTIAFQRRLMESRDKEDARSVLEHMTRATPDYIRNFCSNPHAMLQVLRYAGAELTAKACGILSRTRNLPEAADLEKVLNKSAVRLNANPNILFAELERYGDPENPLTAALLERGKAVDTGVLLRAAHPVVGSETMLWEFAHQKPKSDAAVWAEPWYVIVSGDALWVMDLAARETVNLMQLPGNCQFRLAAQGEELLLCTFTNKYERVQVSRYRLPDLTLLEQGPMMDCPHGNPWKVLAWEGRVYAMQYSSVPDSKGGRYTVSCLNTGEVIFREEFPETIQYALLGSWFVYRNARSGDTLVLSLRDGSCKFRDRFLGTDYLDPNLKLTNYGRLFANTANLYAVYDGALYVLTAGSRIDASGKPELKRRLIRLLPDGEELREDRVWGDEFPVNTISVGIAGRYLAFESQDVITLVEPDTGTVRNMELGQNVVGVKIGMMEHQLLLFLRDKVCAYDLDAFLAAPVSELQDRFPGGRSTVIDRGCLYVMDSEMERVDLKTLELTREENIGWQYWEIYAPWNMRGAELWIGWGQKTGYFSIKDPAKLERLGRFQIPDQDTQELRHAFLYTNAHDALCVGLVVFEKRRTQRQRRGESCAFAAVKLRTKPLSRLNLPTPWEETDLNFEMAVPGEMCPDDPFCVMADGKPYIVLYNGYEDEWNCVLHVYDVLRGRVCYIRQTDLHTGMALTRDSFQCYPGGFMFREMGRKTVGSLVAVNLEGWKAKSWRRELNILTKGQISHTACLLDRDSGEVIIFDARTHEMQTVMKAEKDFWPTNAVVAGDKLILTRSLEDEVRIYDRGDGRLLCRQRLEVRTDDLLYDEDTGTLLMVDIKCRKYFWRLEEWGES